MSGEPVTWRVHLAERFSHIRTATLLIPAPNADAAGAEALARKARGDLDWHDRDHTATEGVTMTIRRVDGLGAPRIIEEE